MEDPKNRDGVASSDAPRTPHQQYMFATTRPDSTTDTAVLLAELGKSTSSRDPGYRIKGELGRGGMAEVLHAEQPAFCRDVALKRLTLAGSVARAAFLSEARIMGRLNHASVVPVHAWVPDGDAPPMLAMKRVVGRSWRAILMDRTMPDPDLD